jgi:cobalt/nickel transport system permease protein
MSHLHLPDGLLPLALWLPALAVALLVLVFSARGGDDGAARRRLGYQGALGALVLAAMSVEIPLGPFEYHLSLIGPIGVLLGAAGAYQVLFVAVTTLAFVGHGGFTVIGLNALVLGAGAALARPLHLALASRWSPAASLAGATAVAQGVSGLLWLGVVAFGLRVRPGMALEHGHAQRTAVIGGAMLALWALGVGIEALVAFGTGRFIARVRPDLLPSREAKP